MKVIDISANNETVNFNEVKKAGYNGVIIRCGGSYDGFFKDSKFEEFYKNAKANGLKAGTYYIPGKDFGKNPSADAEADYQNFKKCIDGKSFELPIFIDIELQSPAYRNGITEGVINIGSRFEKDGYYFGVYGSETLGFKDLMDYSKVKRFGLWVASYSASAPDMPYIAWQYTSKGTINGCSGYLDLNNLADGVCTAIETQGLNKCKKENVSLETSITKTINVKPGETIIIKGV